MLTPGSFLERDYMKSGFMCQGAVRCLCRRMSSSRIGKGFRKSIEASTVDEGIGLSSIIDSYKELDIIYRF